MAAPEVGDPPLPAASGAWYSPRIEFVRVLAAENDETRQTVAYLIACLVGIAIALAVLTVWYWFHTDPKRRREAGSAMADDAEIIETSVAAAERPMPDGPVGDVVDDFPDEPRTETPEDEGSDEFVAGPLMARQTWDFVAAAKRAEDGGGRAAPPPPAAPRIAVPNRAGPNAATSDDLDELAVARRRRELEASRGLSDEVWDTVRRSVFDKLDG